MPTKPTGLGIGILTPRIETDCHYGSDSRPALHDTLSRNDRYRSMASV